jgi:hypothetical protein
VTTPAGLADFDAATPAIPLDQQLLGEMGFAVALGAPVPFNGVAFARSSYIITVDALAPAATTIPFIMVDAFWVDPVTNATIAHERWYLPATTTSPPQANALVAGRGPSKSSVLNLLVTSFDPVQTMTCDLTLYQSTRAVTRDDWRSLGVGALGPGFTNAAADCPALLPGYKQNALLTAGATVQRLCGLYAGEAQFCLIQSAAQNLSWQIQGAQPALVTANWPVVAGAAQTGAQANYSISLPRAPVLVTVTNNGAAGTNVQWAVTAQEFAS